MLWLQIAYNKLLQTLGLNADTKIVQVGLIVLLVLLVWLIIRKAKGLLGATLVVCIVGVFTMLFTSTLPNKVNTTPEVQAMNEVADILANEGLESDTIKMGGDSVLEVKVGDTWYGLDDISSYVDVGDNSVSLDVGGQTVVITDKTTVEVLRRLKDGKQLSLSNFLNLAMNSSE